MARNEDTLQLQELRELASRARLGGLFYAVAWALVAATDSIAQRHPVLVAVGLLGFVLLALLRFRLHPLSRSAEANLRIAWRRIWLVILATTALWGVASAWAIGLETATAARAVALMSSVAFATAMAHSFCMRLGPAALGIALVYLPGLYALLGVPGQGPVAVAISVYLIYIVLALLRSHREYRERLRLEAELRGQRDLYQAQSHRDGLTGLANRRRFETELASLCARSGSGLAPFALIIFDLDHFKSINDRYGHATGDACLVAFSERIRQAFATPGEVCARLGGEEFAVLLPEVGRSDALLRADRLRASLSADALVAFEDCGPVHVTVSGGVSAQETDAYRDAAALYRAADDALYRAKAGGRNAVCAAPESSTA